MANEIWAGRQTFLGSENRSRSVNKVNISFVEETVQRRLDLLIAPVGKLKGPALEAAEECLLNCQKKINNTLYTPDFDKSVDNEPLAASSSFSPRR